MLPGDQFLEKFFNTGQQYPDWKGSLEHFKLAFVEPPRFDRLVNALRPVDDYLKLVVVDGHPRSGKSWAVIKALESVVNDLELMPEEYWTSGLDSLRVFPKDKDDLTTGAFRVQEQLNSKLRLVHLDDFLGTNQLRPLGDSISDHRVRPFLLWNRQENPWLNAMTNGSVLVVTGRSLHFMLLEILLDLNMREALSDSINGLIVVNERRGLFRTVDKVPFGAFDKNTLKKVCENNRKYHPLRDEDPDWFVVATPLVAFDDCISHSRSDEEQRDFDLTAQQKQLAASGLFGEDIDSIAETIKTVQAVNGEDQGIRTWRTKTLGQLYKAYLVTIAPGLLFLDREAYGQLRLDDEIADLVVKGLYLSERIEEFCSGRLPNEFYMIALNDHFTNYLELAAKAFAYVVNPNGEALTDARNIPGLGLRGFLERGLHVKRLGSTQNLLSVPEFKYVIDYFLAVEPDCLLHLERGDSPSNKCSVELNPGLAAAMGWVLKSFSTEETVRQYVGEWFPARFRFLIEQLEASAKTWLTDPNIPHDVRDQERVPDFYRDKTRVIAAYSAFLQWVIRMDTAPQEGGLLDVVVRFHGNLSAKGIIQNDLRIIIEDQLIWAFGEMGYPVTKSFPVERILTFLNDEDDSGRLVSNEGKHLRANRLFSLAWHNKWMEGAPSGFGERAHQWIERNMQSTLEELAEEPELIDDNLEYHWFHFIAQRAVWMRDWCFSEDPNEFERSYSQIAEGSNQPVHNELFSAIAKQVLEAKPINKERIRNLLILSGTRAARINDMTQLTQRIQELTDGDDELSREAKRGVLQAIFELARQGFFEDYSNVNTTHDFRSWCLNRYRSLQSEKEAAWGPYWDGLSSMTHLDLRPRQVDGWPDVIPKSWQFS